MVWLAMQYLWYLVAAVALGTLVGWLLWGRLASARRRVAVALQDQISAEQLRAVDRQAALAAQVETVTRRADAAEREMVELRSSLTMVRTSAVTLERDRTRLLEAHDASSHRAGQAERALFQARAEMVALIPAGPDTAADASALITMLKAHWGNASRQRDEADRRVISSQRQVDRLDAELMTLRRTAGRQLAEVHRHLDVERQSASVLRVQVGKLWVELESAQAVTERVERLQSELEALRRLHEDERCASVAARAHDQATLADAEQRLADMIMAVQGERDAASLSQPTVEFSDALAAASARLVSQWHRRLEIAEVSQRREIAAAEPRRTWAEAKAAEASWLARELIQLRTVHELHLVAAQAGAARQAASRIGVAQESIRPPRRLAPGPNAAPPQARRVVSNAPRPIVLQPLTVGRQRRPATDDLQRVEGISAKVHGALNVAGITSFVRLAVASVDELRDAVASAGLGFDPSLPTWGAQAAELMGGSEEIRPLVRYGAESR